MNGSIIRIWQIIKVDVLKPKVPKCEIFDRSDFHYFYTIKSLREDDFEFKIKKMFLKKFWVYLRLLNSLRICSI
jgi:hypothetical protein